MIGSAMGHRPIRPVRLRFSAAPVGASGFCLGFDLEKLVNPADSDTMLKFSGNPRGIYGNHH
jgi:hypothetical protein